jgi:pyruvate-formate lyase-activating enzyme
MSKKYFPIKTQTSCQWKWAWSTIFLNTGITRSCHRTGESVLDADNFFDFHNTPVKLSDRSVMLEGKWPENSCSYCREIEQADGSSDRVRVSAIPDLTPHELYDDPTLTRVNPTILEVYFNNTCNLGCLYCNTFLSSSIEAENKKHGEFSKHGVTLLKPSPGHFKDLVPYFWQWMEKGFSTIKRLHILGGEPLYQKEFEKLLDYIELYPNPECELNVVTNLMVSEDRVKYFVERFKKLLVERKLKRIDITCSIDCWGPEQEYVRWGIKLDPWEKNFQYLLEQKWLTLHINQTIMPLTVKTMPDLISRLKQWRKKHPVGHFFSRIYPCPDYLKLDIFGGEFFQSDVERIMAEMPRETEQDLQALPYMQGIFNHIKNTEFDPVRVRDFLIYLEEKDRRRGCDWRKTFPWLTEVEQRVVL